MTLLLLSHLLSCASASTVPDFLPLLMTVVRRVVSRRFPHDDKFRLPPLTRRHITGKACSKRGESDVLVFIRTW
ncbi:hypothetical protein GE09DRAFT_183122 [Coniochaeta sp. 2T2.1]|nr:hypothetical protein GE09DRAFT_183122 [Coniochaeta sp. 2T2.1]